MKLTPDDKRLMERMAPGVLCGRGFLGDDPRSLQEILDTDNVAVEKLGLTHQQIAARLAEILAQVIAGFGSPVEIGESFTGIYREAMGRIPSPWGDGVFPKGEVELTNQKTGETIRFTPLSVHLIGRHGFYQGRGSRYRLEPEHLARMTGVVDES